MWLYNQFLNKCLGRMIKILLLVCPSVMHASDDHTYFFTADVLYWKATEEIDWVYDNSLNPTDQQITYIKSDFDAGPGFRLGIGYKKDWDTGIYYTQYSTEATDSATGNLKTAFLAGTVGYPPGHIFYDSGQFKMNIDFNMFDWYFGKQFQISPSLMLHPTIGLEGGWINQSIRADFQGFYDTTEKLNNDFWGVGPKFGIDGALTLLQRNAYLVNFIARFATAYLIGHWDITDVYTDNSPRAIEIGLDNRDLGALSFQGMLGLSLVHHNLSVALSYEINDWLDQGQIFDDATGGHDNDLIFQGLALSLRWAFH